MLSLFLLACLTVGAILALPSRDWVIDFVVYGPQNLSDKVVCPRVIHVSLDGVVGLHVRVLQFEELVVPNQGLIAVGSKSNLFQGIQVGTLLNSMNS